jgi:hypothetical protein
MSIWNEMESRNGMRERYGMKWNRGMESRNEIPILERIELRILRNYEDKQVSV